MIGHKYNIRLLPPTFRPWLPKEPSSKQIAVLMSGGVDSSVTALLLRDAGWDVVGVTMKIPGISSNEPTDGGNSAASVCRELAVPHYFVDVSEAFKEIIVEPFRRSYMEGQTPNPCARCNALIKLGLVWDLLEENFGHIRLATGHYARITMMDGVGRLRMAADKSKDQSYFLYAVAQDRFGRLMLPLGDLTKNEVRATARKMNISSAERPESMDLCFVGQGDYRQVLGDENVNRPGDLTDMQGRKIGDHNGVANYTIGQRRGLRFAGGKPLYIGRIDAATNTVALGSREELCHRSVRATDTNVLIPDELVIGARLRGKIRSYGAPHPCTVTCRTDSYFQVDFDEPQFAPCPGQKLVLYDGDDNVVAGGTIILT
jgi:tRNA-specific 2-thiouridylase